MVDITWFQGKAFGELAVFGGILKIRSGWLVFGINREVPIVDCIKRTFTNHHFEPYILRLLLQNVDGNLGIQKSPVFVKSLEGLLIGLA